MDWTQVRAGDPIESAVVGHRLWRYRLGPPLGLLSYCWGDSELWPIRAPHQANRIPELMNYNGIHAFRTLDHLWGYFTDMESAGRTASYRHLIYDGGTNNPAWFDGLVRGTVALWGVCVDHKRGYRAQFARPASFDEAYGENAEQVLVRLRKLFL